MDENSVFVWVAAFRFDRLSLAAFRELLTWVRCRLQPTSMTPGELGVPSLFVAEDPKPWNAFVESWGCSTISGNGPPYGFCT